VTFAVASNGGSGSLAAALAAVAIQRQLAAQGVPVRIGVHVGEVIVEPERLTGDAGLARLYFLDARSAGGSRSRKRSTSARAPERTLV